MENTENNRRSNIDALEGIFDDHEEILAMKGEEIEASLRVYYPDSDQKANFAWQQLQKARFKRKVQKSKLKWKGQKEKVSEFLKNMPQRSLEVIEDMLRGRDVAMQFRNLKEWNETTIREVFEDVEILDFLDRMEEKE